MGDLVQVPTWAHPTGVYVLEEMFQFLGTLCTPPIAPLGHIDFGLGSTPQGYNFRKAIPPLHYPMCQPHRGLISIELWGFTSLASKNRRTQFSPLAHGPYQCCLA